MPTHDSYKDYLLKRRASQANELVQSHEEPVEPKKPMPQANTDAMGMFGALVFVIIPLGLVVLSWIGLGLWAIGRGLGIW